MKKQLTDYITSGPHLKGCGGWLCNRSRFIKNFRISRLGIRDSQQGGYIVLITVLVLGAVVSLIVGFLLLTGQNASIASNSTVANANAKAAAAGCAELALAAIAADTDMTTPVTVNQTLNPNNGQSCSYTITGTTPNYTISSIGTVTQGIKSYTRRVTVTTNQTVPQVTVASWRDSP